MRLIHANKVFAEWWNTWMSRLHPVQITNAVEKRCQPLPDRECAREEEENAKSLRTVS